MSIILVYVAGLIIGYWFYPLRMSYKLHKIRRQLVQLELDHMQFMEDLKGGQWNEDNL